MRRRIDVLGLIPPGIVPILNRYIPRDLGAGYMAEEVWVLWAVGLGVLWAAPGMLIMMGYNLVRDGLDLNEKWLSVWGPGIILWSLSLIMIIMISAIMACTVFDFDCSSILGRSQ